VANFPLQILAGNFIYDEFNSFVMALKFKCRDVGFDCGFVAKGKTEDEILVQCAVHATKDHNMKPEEVTEELKNKIRANIHKSWF
jgi:predicted small metal-binding protein